jgi:hypothetical protein
LRAGPQQTNSKQHKDPPTAFQEVNRVGVVLEPHFGCDESLDLLPGQVVGVRREKLPAFVQYGEPRKEAAEDVEAVSDFHLALRAVLVGSFASPVFFQHGLEERLQGGRTTVDFFMLFRDLFIPV